MAQVSTDNVIVIRTWIDPHRDAKYEYEYTISGIRTWGSFKKEASLEILAQNFREHGHEAVLEKGHYERVWISDDE
jgi:hypothetical protein